MCFKVAQICRALKLEMSRDNAAFFSQETARYNWNFLRKIQTTHLFPAISENDKEKSHLLADSPPLHGTGAKTQKLSIFVSRMLLQYGL